VPQPLAAWSRARQANLVRELAGDGNPVPPLQRLAHAAAALAADPSAPALRRIRALDFLQRYYQEGRAEVLRTLAHDANADLRAHAIWLIGVNGMKEARDLLVGAVKDGDALVRRRACEALVRAGVQPPVDALWPLLGDGDRFVRHAARLVLQRLDPKLWTDRVWPEANDQTAWQAMIALFHINKAAPYAEPLFSRLQRAAPADAKALVDFLRTVQLALIHVPARPSAAKAIAARCDALFPHQDWRVNRELAVLLTDFQREGQLDHPAVGKLYAALRQSQGDRQQQIHYFYCLRLLKDGWTPQEKAGLAAWYNGTAGWRGGHSFTPFLENIFRDCLQAYTVAERRDLLEKAEEQPLPALVLATRLQVDWQPELFPALRALEGRLAHDNKVFVDAERDREFRQAVLDAVLKTAAAHPVPESWPYLVRGLASSNPLAKAESLHALCRLRDQKPKADDAAVYRNVLLTAELSHNPKDRWQGVELLRRWTGKSFGAAEGKADDELRLWSRWFSQTYPKEPPLPGPGGQEKVASKYQSRELLQLLDRAADGHKGSVARGREVFVKANCAKCHKHGKDGESIGPDLTTLASRFKRADILESILDPSKVISDQYRSTTIITTSGQQVTGLAAVQGDTVTVVLNDASKVTLKKDDIETQVASITSVMPERLLDPLTPEEIVDLFAFLETEPKQPSGVSAPSR
jgi:putative heme-binding domain-containing protein